MKALKAELYCPYCRDHYPWEGYASLRWQPAPCDKCQSDYNVVYAIVRGKRSRKKPKGGRDFNLRVIGHCGKEKLFEWDAFYGEDIELRSKDEIALICDNDRIIVAINFTIARYESMVSPTWMPEQKFQQLKAKREAKRKKDQAKLKKDQAKWDALPWHKKLLSKRPE